MLPVTVWRLRAQRLMLLGQKPLAHRASQQCLTASHALLDWITLTHQALVAFNVIQAITMTGVWFVGQNADQEPISTQVN